MKSLIINFVCFMAGAGVVACALWVINLESVFKGF